MRLRIKAAVLAAAVAAMAALSVSIYADGGDYSSALIDECGVFNDSEAAYISSLLDTISSDVELNVVILVSDDVGTDKSDYGVVDYADCYYDALFGINTDGILLLINEDTKYDYISTSGSGITIFDDYRIESMLDGIYDCLTEGDYYGAAISFARDVNNYGYYGAYDDVYVYDDSYSSYSYEYSSYDEAMEMSSFVFVSGLFTIMVTIMIALGIRSSIKSGYTRNDKVSSKQYLEKGSLCFTESTTTFVREYTVTTSTGSSSGRSGRRSGSHRSSSGGRHGGGGRRR